MVSLVPHVATGRAMATWWHGDDKVSRWHVLARNLGTMSLRLGGPLIAPGQKCCVFAECICSFMCCRYDADKYKSKVVVAFESNKNCQ